MGQLTGLQLSKSSLPSTVRKITDCLWKGGHEAFVVGGCVRSILFSKPIRDFDIATSAPAELVLELFPKAIPIGLHHGTVMIPTSLGPIDITTYRKGLSLEDDLSHRDFTLNSIAIDPRDGRYIDPHRGEEDIRKNILRTPGRAIDRIREDPLRALRAARFIATLGVVPDKQLKDAMQIAIPELDNVRSERKRHELELLLGGKYASRGIRILQETGLETSILGKTKIDTSLIIEKLSYDLTLRLSACLRGLPYENILSSMSFSRSRAKSVGDILHYYPLPIDNALPNGITLRRIVAKIGKNSAQKLILLHRIEIEAGKDLGMQSDNLLKLASWQKGLDLICNSKLPLERSDLKLSGSDIMEILNCESGPHIGSALSFLLECVTKDPSCNQEPRLRGHLLRWASTEKEQ